MRRGAAAGFSGHASYTALAAAQDTELNRAAFGSVMLPAGVDGVGSNAAVHAGRAGCLAGRLAAAGFGWGL